MTNLKKKNGIAQINFITKERTFTALEIVTKITKDPERVAKLCKRGLKIEAAPLVFERLITTPIGQYVDEEGEVEVAAMTGVEEALIIIAVVGTAFGFWVGYEKGKEVGYEEGVKDGQATKDTTDSGDGGDKGGEVEGGGGDDPGGDSGGDAGGGGEVE